MANRRARFRADRGFGADQSAAFEVPAGPAVHPTPPFLLRASSQELALAILAITFADVDMSQRFYGKLKKNDPLMGHQTG